MSEKRDSFLKETQKKSSRIEKWVEIGVFKFIAFHSDNELQRKRIYEYEQMNQASHKIIIEKWNSFFSVCIVIKFHLSNRSRKNKKQQTDAL